MGLEAATYIDDLAITNPASGDVKSQGDDHLRLIKSVLKATFPNFTSALPGGSGNYKLNKYDATVAPGVGDDTADGYAVGSIWIDITGDKAYICLDNSSGAAVWLQIGTGYISSQHLMFFQTDTAVMAGWTFQAKDVDYVIRPGATNNVGGTTSGTASDAGWAITGGTHAHTHTFSDSGTTGANNTNIARDVSADPATSAATGHTHTFSVSGTTSGASVSALSFTGAWRPPTMFGTVWSRD